MAEDQGPGGLVVLAVNAWDEPKSTLQRFVNDKQLRHRVLLNGSRTAGDYGIEAVPATFFIDRSGVVRNVLVGSDPGRLKQYASDIQALPPG